MVSLTLQLIPQRQNLDIGTTQHGQITRLARKRRHELDALGPWGAQGDKGQELGLDADARGRVADLGDDGREGVEGFGLRDEGAHGGVVLDEGTGVEDEGVDLFGGGGGRGGGGHDGRFDNVADV